MSNPRKRQNPSTLAGETSMSSASFGERPSSITFTCNVKWQQIERYMSQYPSLMIEDRPDIIARVFEMKVESFTNFLKTKKPFRVDVKEGDILAITSTSVKELQELSPPPKESKTTSEKTPD